MLAAQDDQVIPELKLSGVCVIIPKARGLLSMISNSFIDVRLRTFREFKQVNGVSTESDISIAQ